METPDFWELNQMTFEHDYKERQCACCDYAVAKTRDLQEFGYNSLTEEQVLKSLWRVLNNEAIGTDIIDQFIKQDKPKFV